MDLEGTALLGFSATDPPRERFGEKLKFLPIAYVVLAKLLLGSIYLSQHVFPLLNRQDILARNANVRGMCELGIFVPTTVMLVICYVRCILTHPGEIPDDPKWEYLARGYRGSAESEVSYTPVSLQETKKSGERRHCKWCGKFKPDRCHHCRVCRTCILKMDHHCPWIYNCVGFYNYKFFILLLFYSAIDCHLILWSMTESLTRCIYDVATPFGNMFLIFFGEFLALVLAGLVTSFLGMHLWLISRGLTTIEFCEKILPKDGRSRMQGVNSMYDIGFFANFRAALGQNVALWLLPIGTPDGDGLSFLCDESCLTKDFGGNAGTRCKTHQPAQRSRPTWPSYGTDGSAPGTLHEDDQSDQHILIR